MASGNCWTTAPDVVCKPAGTVVNSWQAECTIQTPEGPANSTATATVVTDGPAYTVAVEPLSSSISLFGFEGIVDVNTYYSVDTTLNLPDSGDCSQINSTPYGSAEQECVGLEVDFFSQICY